MDKNKIKSLLVIVFFLILGGILQWSKKVAPQSLIPTPMVTWLLIAIAVWYIIINDLAP